MTMIASSSWISAAQKLDRYLPRDLFLRDQSLPTRQRIYDLLIVESDGEYWFNPESATKQIKLDSLTEQQVNVKLFTGYTHCPKCKNDLAPSIPPLPGAVGPNVGFYDFDVDAVRIQHQFACKKCRHQWGPKASGPKDSSLTAVAAPPRDPNDIRAPSGPRVHKVDGISLKDKIDQIFASVAERIGVADWPAFRTAAVAACVAKGVKNTTAATAVSKWRKRMGHG